MTVADRSSQSSPGAGARPAWLAAGVLVAAVVLWGGYSHHWPWTGINGRTATLWDWLHLLLLPFAVGILPIWISHRTRIHRPHKSAALALLAAVTALVVIGYLVPWTWTGFEGNTLWDWLNLIALPLAVALMPVYRELRRRWAPRHTAVAAAVLAAFMFTVLMGYLGGWTWTGFSGNTLWDWLHLLLLPLLLPTVVVPSVRPLLLAGVVFIEAEEAEEHGHGDA